MTAAPSKLYTDDVSLLVVLLDANPFFWGNTSPHHPAAALPFSKFLNHVIPFLNSTLLLHQLNQVVLIAAGVTSCGFIYNSASAAGSAPAVCAEVIERLDEFVAADREKLAAASKRPTASLLSGALSLALCYIQRIFRGGGMHPQPRILCLQGSPDGPEQYVAVMNAIFSAQRSMASYITGGVYLKPQQLEGLFQYLSAVFATDLQSRSFLHLPRPAGVDFRASCFCHKKTIDMGYVCSVCLSIFCKHHKKCSTCGSEFNQSPSDPNSASDRKRKSTEI